jgi:hypothetical protein
VKLVVKEPAAAPDTFPLGVVTDARVAGRVRQSPARRLVPA